MSVSLFAYLELAPMLQEMRAIMAPFGVAYHYTLPADECWDYPMYVFSSDEWHMVYHAGDPAQRTALVDSIIMHESPKVSQIVQDALALLVHRYGGQVVNLHAIQRGCAF